MEEIGRQRGRKQEREEEERRSQEERDGEIGRQRGKKQDREGEGDTEEESRRDVCCHVDLKGVLISQVHAFLCCVDQLSVIQACAPDWHPVSVTVCVSGCAVYKYTGTLYKTFIHVIARYLN